MGVEIKPRVGDWAMDGFVATMGSGLLLRGLLAEASSGTYEYAGTGLLIIALMGSINLSLKWRRVSRFNSSSNRQ